MSQVKWILDHEPGSSSVSSTTEKSFRTNVASVERKGQLGLGGEAIPPSTVFLITSQTLIRLSRNSFRVTSKKPYFKVMFRDFKINSRVLRNLLSGTAEWAPLLPLSWKGNGSPGICLISRENSSPSLACLCGNKPVTEF